MQLYAQPYDMHAKGFYFSDLDEFQKLFAENVNEFGQPVEEYEFQVIEGLPLVHKLVNHIGYGFSIEDVFTFLEEFEGDELALVKFTFLKEYTYHSFDLEFALEKLPMMDIFEGTGEDYAREYLESIGLFDADTSGIMERYFDFEEYAQWEIDLPSLSVGWHEEYIWTNREDV